MEKDLSADEVFAIQLQAEVRLYCDKYCYIWRCEQTGLSLDRKQANSFSFLDTRALIF